MTSDENILECHLFICSYGQFDEILKKHLSADIVLSDTFRLGVEFIGIIFAGHVFFGWSMYTTRKLTQTQESLTHLPNA